MMTLLELSDLFENNTDTNNLLDVLNSVLHLYTYLGSCPEDEDIIYYKFIVNSDLDNLKKYPDEQDIIEDSFTTGYDIVLALLEKSIK